MTITILPVSPDQVVPDVSVIVVNWNTRDILRQCLQSVFRSRGIAYEVWVVDNGSADGSADMIYSDLKHTPNSQSRECGVCKSQQSSTQDLSGTLCVVTPNSDAFIPADALVGFVAFMDQSPDAAVVGPRYANLDGSFQASYAGFSNSG